MGSRPSKTADTASRPASAFTGAGRGNEGTAPTDQAEVAEALAQLRFDATCNGRYHLCRRGWYESLHRWAMFIVVMGGAGVVAQAIGQRSVWQVLLPLLVTAAGTLEFVFDFAGKAAHHARLQERSYDVLAEIEECVDDHEEVCRRGRAAITRMYAQETKTMRVVQALAYNDTKEASEEDSDGSLIVVPWYARASRHLFAFDGLKLTRARKLASEVPRGRIRG